MGIVGGSDVIEDGQVALLRRDVHMSSKEGIGKRQNSERRLFIAHDLLQSSGQEQRDLKAHPYTFVLPMLFCGPLF